MGFWGAHPLETTGKSALVIASGLGDDAEQLAEWGYKTTAFDQIADGAFLNIEGLAFHNQEHPRPEHIAEFFK